MTREEAILKAVAFAEVQMGNTSREQGMSEELINAHAIINRESVAKNVATFIDLFDQAGLMEFSES